MKCKFLLPTVSFLSFCLLLPLTACANKTVAIDYSLNRKPGVDLSTFTRGPLRLEQLQDGREDFKGTQISDSLTINIAVADLVTNAIQQGFAQGGATLVTTDAKQIMVGEVIELSSVPIEKEGGKQIQVTVRAKIQLKSANNNKTYWQSTIFGRANVAENEGVNAAIQQALDKFVVGLFNDDYLLIELIE